MFSLIFRLLTRKISPEYRKMLSMRENFAKKLNLAKHGGSTRGQETHECGFLQKMTSSCVTPLIITLFKFNFLPSRKVYFKVPIFSLTGPEDRLCVLVLVSGHMAQLLAHSEFQVINKEVPGSSPVVFNTLQALARSVT